MQVNYLAFIIPAFLFFCILEYIIGIKQGKYVYNFAETISNLNVGIFERTCDLFTTVLFHFLFVWLYEHFAIFQIPNNIWVWIILFLITDLLWYWYHRFGHRINLLWSAHVVHHQSEDFNFTVAARITIFQAMFRSIFWAFIPILGFPPEMITSILLIHGAYPFFTHTQVVGKLGILEKFMVTPSHHRVHHSSNDKYLDKNYGDVLIIWDKMFGTFIEEDPNEKPVYGITDSLNSYSFLWQHFHFVLEIIVAFKYAKGWKAKWNTIFGPPDIIDPNYRGELEKKLLIPERAFPLSKLLARYIVVNTLCSIAFVFVFLWMGYQQNAYQLILGGLFVFVNVIFTGAILEQRKWIFSIEFTRWVILFFYLWFTLSNMMILTAFSILLIFLMLFYNSAQKQYFKILSNQPAL